MALEIYGCEPETAAPLAASLAQGRPVRVERTPSFVDAIGTPEVLPAVFERVSALVAGSLVVSLADVRSAMKTLLLQHKLLCEGAGAAGLAGAIRLAQQSQHRKIVCVLTGGNVAPELVAEVLAVSPHIRRSET